MKKLGFGMMRLPLLEPGKQSAIDQEQVNRMADYFLENGFTYADTAYMYHGGMSEVAVRKAFAERHPRDSFVLADKMPVAMVKSTDDYPRIFAEQQKRCGVDYFDYYLLHDVNRLCIDNVEQTGGFEFMKKLKEEGKARRIGFSYHDNAELLDKILDRHPEMEFVQLQINYVDWDNEAIQSGKCYEVCVKHGKPVIVMEPVKGGALAKVPEEIVKMYKSNNPDASIASWAVRYAASLDNLIVVLSGKGTKAVLFLKNISGNYHTSSVGFYYIDMFGRVISAEMFKGLDMYTGTDINDFKQILQDTYEKVKSGSSD